jgi:hypothetical protein
VFIHILRLAEDGRFTYEEVYALPAELSVVPAKAVQEDFLKKLKPIKAVFTKARKDNEGSGEEGKKKEAVL